MTKRKPQTLTTEQWRDRAMDLLVFHLTDRHGPRCVTVDTLWEYLGGHDLPAPKSRRTIGAVVQDLVARGYLRRDAQGATAPSLTNRHRQTPIWVVVPQTLDGVLQTLTVADCGKDWTLVGAAISLLARVQSKRVNP